MSAILLNLAVPLNVIDGSDSEESSSGLIALPSNLIDLNFTVVLSDTPGAISIALSFSIDGENFITPITLTEADFVSSPVYSTDFTPLCYVFVKVDVTGNTDPVDVTVSLLAKRTQ